MGNVEKPQHQPGHFWALGPFLGRTLSWCVRPTPSPEVGRAGFRSPGSEAGTLGRKGSFQALGLSGDSPIPPPRRLPVEVRACQHVPVRLHASPLRPQRRTPADGRGLHQQPPRYRASAPKGWVQAHVLRSVLRERTAARSTHTLGHCESQHMAVCQLSSTQNKGQVQRSHLGHSRS